MNSYEKIYNLLTERRGAKSKAARKARGTEAERREGVFGAGLSGRGGAKQKQADIESDKELTRAGASSSSDPKSKRYSPSLHTMHNAPENVKRRKHSVVISRSDRSNQRHADDVAKGREEKRQRDQAAIDRAEAARRG